MSGFATVSPCEAALTSLLASCTSLQANSDKVVAALTWLIEWSPEKDKDGLETDLDDYADERANYHGKLLDAIATMERTLRPPPSAIAAAPAATAAASAAPRVQMALMPSTLERDMSPEEFNNCSLQMEAFFSTSRLEQMSIPVQHHYVYKCLDGELQTFLRGLVNNMMPVFGDSGCCAFL